MTLEELETNLLNFDYAVELPSIIKVVGVGGGGGNAVTKMFTEGIEDVSFVLCNTDMQAMRRSPIPNKVQLGTEGLGAGGDPDVARKFAEESLEQIKEMLSGETRMVFITAGMGGGTGTGASPVVARVAREMGILTVGVVTIPFMFEETFKILQALKGVEEIKKNVDALLVINNELLRGSAYADLTLPEAFKRADDTLTNAVRSISEMITIPGYINLDFADVKTVLKNGGFAVMNSGFGQGEDRVSQAIINASESPLLNNNNFNNAKKILLNISFSSAQPVTMREMTVIHDFMAKFRSDIEMIWGTATDESLEDRIKIAILASGFGIESFISKEAIQKAQQKLSEEEEQERQKEEQRKKIEEEERALYEANLIKKYYGEDALRRLGKTSRPHPFIFTSDNIDDNDTIEAVINNPAYNRSPRVMLEIARKAEERRKTAV